MKQLSQRRHTHGAGIRGRSRWWYAVGALLLLVALPLTACGGQGGTTESADQSSASNGSGGSSTTQGGEKVLRIGIPADIVTLDPQMATDLYSGMAYANMFEAVLTRDLKGQPAAALATDWSSSDDGLTWTFTIRQGVKFHDGTDLTLDDVVYSIQRIMDPANAAPRQAQFAGAIEAVQAEQPDKIVITLKEPNAAFLSLMAYAWVVPQHAASQGKDSFAMHPIGTGPYRYVEWKPGDHATLTRFDDYWGGRPPLDQVVLRPIPEASTRTVELESGGIDLMPSVAPQDVQRLGENAKLMVMRTDGANFRFFVFNTSQPPFSDKRLRQAFGYAINKQQIVDTIYPGVGRVAAGPIPPMSFAYDPEFKGIQYDLDKAKQLLAEAGDPSPKIELMTSSGDLNHREAQLVQAMLGEAGFQATVRELEWGTFLSNLKDGTFQVGRLGWTTTPEPNDLLYNRYHTGDPSFNSSRYSNPQVDKLLEDGLHELDQQKRAEIYRQAQAIIVDDAPEFHIFHESRVYAMDKKVQGFQPHYGGEVLLMVPSLGIKVDIAQ